MDSKIAMRFYRVERRDDAQPEFAVCLQKVAAIVSDDDRIRDVADAVIGSTALNCTGSLYWGDLLRHQTSNLPSLVQKGKPPARLELPDGAGLGHHTAFIYDPKTEMLGYQFTRGSVSMERFNLYVTDICGCTTFLFLPVIRAAELQALAKMRAKTFKIKVADPVDLEAVDDDQKSLRESLIHLQECMDGAYIRITLGMGRKEGVLEKVSLRKTIAWLLAQRAKGRGKVQLMQVEGKNLDDSPADPLNFLKAHLGDDGTVDVDGMTPAENFQARLAFMKRAAAANASALRKFVKAA